jgi:DNA (cytosine-5)-methyltransferase 1
MKAPNLFTIYKTMENQENMNMQMQLNKVQTIRTIELFAGVGGFRVGLEKASHKDKKFQIVWSNQWEPSTKTQHASDVYCARFGYENHSNDDISTVSTVEIPNHDLLVGGFPCQDYSVASTLKNANGIVGKKGVLWWQIYRILEEKKDNAPKYLMLENVDRLLKSPATQRGRDFALILASLNSLGYAVEWRVIDASVYGMPQRRKRIFIMGYKKGTNQYNSLKNNVPKGILNSEGIFAKAFPINEIESKNIITKKLHSDLVDITQNFNKETPKSNPFLDAGYMIDGVYHTCKITPNYSGKSKILKDILEEENAIPKEFYIDDEDLKKWQYQKGGKSFERINKTTGHIYNYSEGSMSFPDSLDKPARTIITGEGGASASRFKHVVCVNGRYRRLTPVELERANMFPDNHTFGVTDTKRAFLMGNALVVGIVEKLGEVLLKEIN